jgi:hypothetical protein
LNNLFSPYHFKEDLTLGKGRSFTEKAMDIFHVQANYNPLYQRYLKQLSVDPQNITQLAEIPFLPISFFKSHVIKTGDFEPEVYFESSGTTGVEPSRHGILSQSAYLQNAKSNFNEFYGDVENYCVLALLPSYLERGNSSLVAMADYFIKLSGHGLSGFFLNDLDRLHAALVELESAEQPTILLGVTYALMDFAEKFPIQLKHTIVMETGGMKGRREEITRGQLHSFLCERLGVEQIHAEYGMTELQSQAYSKGGGWFSPSATMKVMLRSPDDPFEIWEAGQYAMRSGAVNIIDLANSDTISFIATDDLARFRSDGSFEITGRMDNCDIRGCSQLAL